MIIFLIFISALLIIYLNRKYKKSTNRKLQKFKNNLLSKESNIEKIFLREDEKTSSNPNINIILGLFENEKDINRKSNIHRARLAKYKKSTLNGEIIYLDEEDKLYKYVQGKKIYFDK